MPLIVFLDETGDHTLEIVDKDFPIFVSTMLICDSDIYNRSIVPMTNKIKHDYFGHEGVIIHSRDIRKAQRDFGFLTDRAKRPPFYARINQLMSESQYQIIATAIRKQQHKDRYGVKADNPYDMALTFSLERLLPLLEEARQDKVEIIAESRGAKEDKELNLVFLRTVNYGTYYIESSRFKKIQFKLDFRPKAMNIVGNQMADLAGYPIARHVLEPQKPNPAFDLIKAKFYRGYGSSYGLKIFP